MKHRRSEQGQVVVLAVLFVAVFIGLAAALTDVFIWLEARNWAYNAAQKAAQIGTAKGRKWSTVTSNRGCLEPMILDESVARQEAEAFLQEEITQRSVAGATYDIRVLPGASGGSIAGFPPQPTRLGSARGSWSTAEPSVGVYLSFPLQTFFLAFFGQPQVDVNVFASSSVHQPAGVCP